MRKTLDSFLIDGKPILCPDEEVVMSYEDIDAADSGRDESGVMHRLPLRYKVGSWRFSYSHLTEEEKQYMENLFPDGGDFAFTHPSRRDAKSLVTEQAYRSKYAISWKNARTGLWSNYGFSIIAC